MDLKLRLRKPKLIPVQELFLHPIVISLLLIIPFVGSFFLWTVNVESDVPEVAERIEEKLKLASQLFRFVRLILIPDEGEIRRDLMQDDPSLSWVRFKRIGTTLTVIPMLSPASDHKCRRERSHRLTLSRAQEALLRVLN